MKYITVFRNNQEELVLQIAETPSGEIKGVCQEGYSISVDGIPLSKGLRKYQLNKKGQMTVKNESN